MSSATVIIPERMPGPFPVLYLLHGMSDDHTTWVRRTSIERYVEHLPLIVVMPNGDRSFYLDAITKPASAYETYIVQELVGFMDNTFRTIPARPGRVIAGLSMGGYGALSLALKYPDMFCAASSHSGALGFCSRPLRKEKEWRAEFVPLVGTKPKGGNNDLFALAKKADKARLPSLRIDCGRKDFLIEENRMYHRHLRKLKIEHVYREYPGGHSWQYWDTHIQDTIRFFIDKLEIAREQ